MWECVGGCRYVGKVGYVGECVDVWMWAILYFVLFCFNFYWTRMYRHNLVQFISFTNKLNLYNSRIWYNSRAWCNQKDQKSKRRMSYYFSWQVVSKQMRSSFKSYKKKIFVRKVWLEITRKKNVDMRILWIFTCRSGWATSIVYVYLIFRI